MDDLDGQRSLGGGSGSEELGNCVEVCRSGYVYDAIRLSNFFLILILKSNLI
jgi:hypothetical protein